MMLTMKTVRGKTREFFKRHWHSGQLRDNQPPVWSRKPFSFRGKIPNGTSRGVYALMEGKEVVYIGLGVRVGKGIYEGHGLNGRLKGYLRRSRWRERLTGEGYQPIYKWKKLTGIHTIGFPRAYSYLANSLEAYLLRLSPRKNKNLTLRQVRVTVALPKPVENEEFTAGQA